MAVQIVLTFLWAFYWPLLFVRLKGSSLTKNKLAACAMIAAAAAVGNFFLNYTFFFQLSLLSSAMILSALISPAILLLLSKARKKRTHAKLLVLAGYFHIFWQLLPSISASPVIADAAVTAAIFAAARLELRKKRREHVHGPISELWK